MISFLNIDFEKYKGLHSVVVDLVKEEIKRVLRELDTLEHLNEYMSIIMYCLSSRFKGSEEKLTEDLLEIFESNEEITKEFIAWLKTEIPPCVSEFKKSHNISQSEEAVPEEGDQERSAKRSAAKKSKKRDNEKSSVSKERKKKKKKEKEKEKEKEKREKKDKKEKEKKTKSGNIWDRVKPNEKKRGRELKRKRSYDEFDGSDKEDNQGEGEYLFIFFFYITDFKLII